MRIWTVTEDELIRLVTEVVDFIEKESSRHPESRHKWNPGVGTWVGDSGGFYWDGLLPDAWPAPRDVQE